LDVWSDDVLKDVLRDSRRRRRVRRRLRVVLVGFAVAAGAAGGMAGAGFLPAALVSAPPPPPANEPAQVADRPQQAAPHGAPAIALPAAVELLAGVGIPTPLGDGSRLLEMVLASLPEASAATAPGAVDGTDLAARAQAALAAVVEDVLQPGDTLTVALARHGVAQSTVALITRELRGHFDFRRAKPGHRYRIERNDQGALVAFRYQVSDVEHYDLEAKGKGYEARGTRPGLLRQQARLSGIVATTLYDAVEDLGEQRKLAADLANIFAWEFDFTKGVRPGDEFHVLYERTYRPRSSGGDLRYLGPGRILAARYKSGARTLEAVYYETAAGRGGYYRPSGESVRQAFLAAPLHYSRITSSFTQARFHPILRRTRPHPGIDYAAPAGTPVWAVASGRVTHVGWKGGYGRLVTIEHGDGYESYYAHLAGYGSGLRVGQRVDQRQVIGYVGSSGLSTGPHVCFRMAKNSRFVNPASVQIPSGDRIPARQRQDFETVRDARIAQLGPAPAAATHEAM
jgi:murein DD-endopeptidase MepM/ murein hydrolase activator NlpD